MKRIYDTLFSTYEVDEEEKKIRRINGLNDPTPRMGEDGVWKSYEKIHPNPEGILIVWAYVDGVAKCTRTSPLVMVTP